MASRAFQADYLVVGGGIAGASIAYWLSRCASVIVLEREGHAGYHSTGRSAALFLESYGPPQARALTRASRQFLQHPPIGFCEHPLLAPRQALVFCQQDQQDKLEGYEHFLRSVSESVVRLDAAQALALVPVLQPDGLAGALLEPLAHDIDVDALLQGFIRGARAGGSRMCYGTEVLSLHRADGCWHARTTSGTYQAPVLINAAGAWAEQIGALAGAAPIGLIPKRRSVMLFEPPAALDIRAWPMFMDVDESFYIKPDAGMLLGSPCNADPVEPHDVQAEELDIAIAIDAIERLTTLKVRRPRHTWAGLRSFVGDGDLVGGFDPLVPGLFWAAGQGGYGVQTAAAAGQLYAAMASGSSLPAHLAECGVRPEELGLARLGKAS